MLYIYMVTFTINIPQMLAYIPAPWILWDIKQNDHLMKFGDVRVILMFLSQDWVGFFHL